MRERRKTPRVDVVSSEYVRMDVRHRVRLLDISLTGALIAAGTELPVGTRGLFTVALAAEPFIAELKVGRHQAGRSPEPGLGMGAVFAAMDQRSRRQLELFLRRASN